jgi:MoxR-like ATPase
MTTNIHALPDNLPLAVDAVGNALPVSPNYILDQATKDALRFAWARGRPLLITGEAGTGKSMLGQGIANALKLPFFLHVMQSTSNATDLLWQMDHVQRLADTQIRSVGNGAPLATSNRLDQENYTRPGVLWQAWNPQRAAKAGTALGINEGENAELELNNGCVVLIDEIDKAPHDVPNNLLDVLDTGSFALPWGERIGNSAAKKPLILITSNGDKALPAAFLRRCIVLQLKVDEIDLEAWLVKRGTAHFHESLSTEVLARAAAIIKAHRNREGALYRVGVSEYIDLLHAVKATSTKTSEQLTLLDTFAPFIQKDVGR